MGHSHVFKTRGAAAAYAEELTDEHPFSVYEVARVYNPNGWVARRVM